MSEQLNAEAKHYKNMLDDARDRIKMLEDRLKPNSGVRQGLNDLFYAWREQGLITATDYTQACEIAQRIKSMPQE